MVEQSEKSYAPDWVVAADLQFHLLDKTLVSKLARRICEIYDEDKRAEEKIVVRNKS